MAIDDNTVYGLTGAQIKELPAKIDAVKGLAKELTADDCNWPTSGTKTAVATWLLDPGVYTWESGVTVLAMAYPSGVSNNISPSGTAYVIKTSNREYAVTVCVGWAGGISIYPASVSTGTPAVGSYYENVLVAQDIVNNLYTASVTAPLSANQGKVLNDKIGGDLSNLTTTDKTSLINAINELEARIAALEGS